VEGTEGLGRDTRESTPQIKTAAARIAPLPFAWPFALFVCAAAVAAIEVKDRCELGFPSLAAQ